MQESGFISSSTIHILIYVIGGLIALSALFGFFFTVQQKTVGIVERFGKFNRIATAGLNFKIPFIESWYEVSLQIEQLVMHVQTMTVDDVSVILEISLQKAVIPEKVVEAFYELVDADEQIKSFVFDVVRAVVPKMTLKEVFQKKDTIAIAVGTDLREEMHKFGFQIVGALVKNVVPDSAVTESMNAIKASENHRQAAINKADGEREAMRLQGQGVAAQRTAITEGLRASVEELQGAIPGATPGDVMVMVMMAQYFDAAKDIAAASKTNTIFTHFEPAGVGGIIGQVRNAIMSGQAADT